MPEPNSPLIYSKCRSTGLVKTKVREHVSGPGGLVMAAFYGERAVEVTDSGLCPDCTERTR